MCVHEGFRVRDVINLLRRYPQMDWFPVVDILHRDYVMPNEVGEEIATPNTQKQARVNILRRRSSSSRKPTKLVAEVSRETLKKRLNLLLFSHRRITRASQGYYMYRFCRKARKCWLCLQRSRGQRGSAFEQAELENAIDEDADLADLVPPKFHRMRLQFILPDDEFSESRIMTSCV